MDNNGWWWGYLFWLLANKMIAIFYSTNKTLHCSGCRNGDIYFGWQNKTYNWQLVSFYDRDHGGCVGCMTICRHVSPSWIPREDQWPRSPLCDNVSDADPCHSHAASFTHNFRTFWVNCSFYIKLENDCYNISSILELQHQHVSTTKVSSFKT